ncbi:hypothetical protein FocnCong_v020756 [Fusarium oxysporum f. sp. conglutinans]|nr:hypothetical protein FocnCong_v020756 [Fusarium oxysporum f. sp. conglutinans]
MRSNKFRPAAEDPLLPISRKTLSPSTPPSLQLRRRVYSKDESLELRTIMEAGELLEGGMGSKQAADFENAQSSAGGGRAGDKDASGDKAV